MALLEHVMAGLRDYIIYCKSEFFASSSEGLGGKSSKAP